ncbi:hypothetical protein [Psychrobacter sp. WY6]|uniref:hypothetical protein n=1 Tax=Psychrobacter sp. WY6 TaxID=2708350 RepID=UPI002023147C|nr:hypothetical protein [Psychrobacter sp. WY6]
MIPLINAILALLGLAICTVFLISDRFNTASKETILQLSLWITVWIFLVEAALPSSSFEPSWSTTIARATCLLLNVWHFKQLIISRCKNKHAP